MSGSQIVCVCLSVCVIAYSFNFLQQKELFSSARKPVASVSRMPAALDRASAAKLKEVELEVSLAAAVYPTVDIPYGLAMHV